MVNYMAGIRKRILRLRNREGMTQAEFGEALGIAQQYVASLETGYRRPSGSLVFMMAAKFDVAEDWLKRGKGRLPDTAAFLPAN
jgi:transcriptional regulator with XRE-family HTH domain